MIDSIFWFCVMLIQWLGEVTGMGYNLTNLALFVVLQPALIIVFLYFGGEKLENVTGINGLCFSPVSFVGLIN